LKKIIALTLASLSLTIGPATAAQASPGPPPTHAPAAVPPRVSNAALSTLRSKLAALHLQRGAQPSARELKALGLRPDPGWLAARFKKLTHSTRASVADVGTTYWFTWNPYGQIWANVYYAPPFTDPYGDTQYDLFSNYWVCDSHGNNCIDTNIFTVNDNIQINGTYYYDSPGASTPDSEGFPAYGFGPYSG